MRKPERKIVIPGGTGFVGRFLVRHFLRQDDDVVVLTRNPSEMAPERQVQWDGRTEGAWTRELEGADLLINLTGRSVNCRYNGANRREILESRVESTRILGAACGSAKSPPPVWLNAASATIYRDARDRPMDETTGEIGDDFSMGVCKAWEREFETACPANIRGVMLRSAITFGVGKGGPFEVFYQLARFGLGGTIASGGQMVSWIHESDLIGAIEWIYENENFSGPVNLTSPNPLPNHQFMAELRRAVGQPIGLPCMRWMLAIGTFLLRTEAELVLKSRWVLPTRLLNNGFRFEHPDWPGAARELVCRRTATRM